MACAPAAEGVETAAGVTEPIGEIDGVAARVEEIANAIRAAATSARPGSESPRRFNLFVPAAVFILPPWPALRNRHSEQLHDLLNIGPDQSFVGGIAKKIAQDGTSASFDTAKVLPVAAQLAYRGLDLEQRLDREGSQADNRARPHLIDLAEQKGLAGHDLVGLRIAIFRRPALDDVADVDFRAGDPHPAFDDIGEQLAGAAHERLATHVLIGARRFTDKHQVGMRVADAENDIMAKRVKLAAGNRR